MNRLVKQGTARRLGLTLPEPELDYVGLFQFAMPTRPSVPAAFEMPDLTSIFAPMTAAMLAMTEKRTEPAQ